MTTCTNLIARLRSRSATQPENFGLDDEVADALEAQAARIAELEEEAAVWEERARHLGWRE